MSDDKLCAAQGGNVDTFQKRVLNWLMECFSMEVCRDGTERNHRFLDGQHSPAGTVPSKEGFDEAMRLYNRMKDERDAALASVEGMRAALTVVKAYFDDEFSDSADLNHMNRIQRFCTIVGTALALPSTEGKQP